MADQDIADLLETNSKEAIFAEQAENYGEALRLFRVCEGILSVTPDGSKDGWSLEWSEKIAAHIERLEKITRRTATSGKVQRVGITYARVGT